MRVVEIGDYSRELCGGTHVAPLRRSSAWSSCSRESSIGSGVRRVEALVGLDAFRFLAARARAGRQLAEQFKARPEELPERIGGVVERLREAEKELEKVRADAVLSSAGALADGAEDVGGIALVAAAVPDGVAPATTCARWPPTCAAGSAPGRASSRCSPPTTRARCRSSSPPPPRPATRGLAAGELVPAFAPAVGGRGGGKPDLAQGGGTDPSGVPAAIDALRRELASR